MSISYLWRSLFNNEEVNHLHAETFHHPLQKNDWWTQVHRHSLGWVCAQQEKTLIGFVNVVWDGGVHAFLLDIMVAATWQKQKVGTNLVAIAEQKARIAGCQWLHVDFEDHLAKFYFGNCGFQPTQAGLIALQGSSINR